MEIHLYTEHHGTRVEKIYLCVHRELIKKHGENMELAVFCGCERDRVDVMNSARICTLVTDFSFKIAN